MVTLAQTLAGLPIPPLRRRRLQSSPQSPGDLSTAPTSFVAASPTIVSQTTDSGSDGRTREMRDEGGCGPLRGATHAGVHARSCLTNLIFDWARGRITISFSSWCCCLVAFFGLFLALLQLSLQLLLQHVFSCLYFYYCRVLCSFAHAFIFIIIYTLAIPHSPIPLVFLPYGPTGLPRRIELNEHR